VFSPNSCRFWVRPPPPYSPLPSALLLALVNRTLKVGQSVYAIGNPSGLSKTLTSGVVSGLDRAIPAPTGTRIYGAIQVCRVC
jgi:hypothetical protein